MSQVDDYSTAALVQHEMLSDRLYDVRKRLSPPNAEKELRQFKVAEVSSFLGVSETAIRKASMDEAILGSPLKKLANNHAAFDISQINALRAHFARTKPKQALQLLPHRTGNEHLQILTVANFKGGSAKTTTALHLTQYLALQGFRVLAIDLDPQASLTNMFGIQPEFDVESDETIYSVIKFPEKYVERDEVGNITDERWIEPRPIGDIIRKTYFDGIDLIPGDLELMEIEHETPRILAHRKDDLSNPFFMRLKTAIMEVEHSYDVVVLDTPPSLGYLTLGAIYACTAEIKTIHPAMVDLASMSQFLKMKGDLSGVIRDAGADLSKDFINFLITRHDPTDESQAQIVGLLRGLFFDDVFTPTALQSASISAAGLAKNSIYEAEPGPNQRKTFNRGLDSMNAVNGAILDRILKSWGRI